jgi:deoxyribodipyrimidine photo-lyase
MKKEVSIFWFRRDLRVEDNTALWNALTTSQSVLPIFIFDKTILVKLSNKNDKRVSFIYEQLQCLQQWMVERGTSLQVFYATPIEAWEQLVSFYSIKAVYVNHDYEPYAIGRDAAVQKYVGAKGISWNSFKDQVIFEKSEIMKPDGTPYTVFTPYSVRWKKEYVKNTYRAHSIHNQHRNFLQTPPLPFPTLQEIGFNTIAHGVKKIQLSNSLVQDYSLNRDYPAADATSHTSVHLRFGTVSIRRLCSLAASTNETWLTELIWREFFMMILFHFPYVSASCFKKKYDAIAWRNNELEFSAWCNGETGYPMVDAGMRQLNATGDMHNRLRMITASFLTKHLLVDWRWGELYFAEKLTDFERSSNNGNWQWVAGCGCDAAPYFRIFNPHEQQKKFDPQLEYIKKWIPHFNTEYPAPIVEHSYARARALDVYKNAWR